MLVFYVNRVPLLPLSHGSHRSPTLLQRCSLEHSPLPAISLMCNRGIALSQQFTLPNWFCLINLTAHLLSVNH